MSRPPAASSSWSASRSAPRISASSSRRAPTWWRRSMPRIAALKADGTIDALNKKWFLDYKIGAVNAGLHTASRHRLLGSRAAAWMLPPPVLRRQDATFLLAGRRASARHSRRPSHRREQSLRAGLRDRRQGHRHHRLRHRRRLRACLGARSRHRAHGPFRLQRRCARSRASMSRSSAACRCWCCCSTSPSSARPALVAGWNFLTAPLQVGGCSSRCWSATSRCCGARSSRSPSAIPPSSPKSSAPASSRSTRARSRRPRRSA